MKKNVRASMLACLAALFYALNMPFSKLLLNQVGPTMMAAFLYLGAGMGMSVLYMLDRHNNGVHDRLTKPDLPYTVMNYVCQFRQLAEFQSPLIALITVG